MSVAASPTANYPGRVRARFPVEGILGCSIYKQAQYQGKVIPGRMNSRPIIELAISPGRSYKRITHWPVVEQLESHP